ncbi:penicillin-binding protein [Anaerobacillus alkaliphilus]|uniref:Penicillin-binding protein n=2 Tax=Anaerobacillus alkaliphilus TaxID=1548597 RepID=A0A4Q0VU45_9BACI|nr:penicillin-binding protein [Anaerobacillus alkaliphilus]
MFITLFSFTLIGLINEFNAFQSITSIVKESVYEEDFVFHSNSYIYDEDGEIISDVYSNENRIYVPYNDIPQMFLYAMIATEDRNFFSHKGFDMAGITRALFINAEKQGIEQGGSTITQQLVKNIYLSNERSYNRKLTEVLYAYHLENLFSKEDILEFYANTIYFQNGVYGIEAASRFYFSKSAKQLSVSELAFLAAIPNNPTLYNPMISPENTHRRKEWILTKMFEMNYLTEEQFKTAKSEKIALTPTKKVDRFPDYITYIHFELEQLVGEQDGFNTEIALATTTEEKSVLLEKRRLRVDQLLKSGIHIYTGFQSEKQNQVIQTIKKHLPENDIQGVAVMINHYTHEIVAITGGKDFNKFDFHRGFQAYRQPGSSIKPLLVFAPYFAETNSPINKSISAAPFCKDSYCPQNYGGSVYGNVRIDVALKHSYNTAAVRMLDEITVEKGFSYLEKFNFAKTVDEDYRLPAALGGLTFGVSPLELTKAYTTFANDGIFQDARGIQKVVDQNGKLLYQWEDKPKQVWSSEVNEKMLNLLTKVVTEGTGRKANFTSSYIGGKTGTTNEFFDLWFVGLTENYTTGVWVGQDQPQSLASINSRSPHLLIWRDIMKE